MKRLHRFLALLSILLLSMPLAMAEKENPGMQISFGGEFGAGGSFDSDESASGSLLTLEWEPKVTKNFTIPVRLMAFDYKWDNGEDGFAFEEEDGDGIGIGAEFRWYVTHESFQGLWLGVGLGVFDGTWEFKRAGIVTESGDDVAIEAHFGLGYTFRITRVFGLTPTFVIGSYESDSPQSGVFAGIGLRFNFGIGES